jgi:protein arginine kinase activator
VNCQTCAKEKATLQYTEVVGTVKKVQWLCQRCAELRGLMAWQADAASAVEQDGTGPELVGPYAIEPTGTAVKVGHARRCEACGTSLVAIRRSGRVGCPQCYETFREHLEPLLRRVHGAVEHRGNAPVGRGDVVRQQVELSQLRRELQEAVRREDYERAARLRDEIHRREAETIGRGAQPA